MIGKTFVAAGLIRELRRRGRQVEALKPVVSGFDPAWRAGERSGRPARRAAERAAPKRSSASRRGAIAAPLSPDMAARRRRTEHRFRRAGRLLATGNRRRTEAYC